MRRRPGYEYVKRSDGGFGKTYWKWLAYVTDLDGERVAVGRGDARVMAWAHALRARHRFETGRRLRQYKIRDNEKEQE